MGVLRDVVLAPDHVADPHRRVVHDDREVVERRPVRPDDDEVAAEVRRVDLDPVADEVVPRDDAGADAEPDGAPPALGLARGALVGRQGGAPADVARRQLVRLLGSCRSAVELLGRAVAGIGAVRGEQRARPPPRSRGEALPSGGTARTGRPPRSPATPGPSSQVIPSQWRPSRMSCSNAAVLRATSVSSSRSTNVPPVWRANRKLNSAVRAVPMCSGPVGLGAIRTRMSAAIVSRERPGTTWNSARVGVARAGRGSSAAGRRPSVARPRGPSSVSESRLSERARIVIGAPGRERPRLEVGQEARRPPRPPR